MLTVKKSIALAEFGRMFCLFNAQPVSPISRLWLCLAIAAITAGGLFSLPPVILRGHFFEQLFDTQHIFSVSLIIHVNLTILFWILSMSSALWSHVSTKHYYLHLASYILADLGITALIISPFLSDTIAYTNNYIPMLNNWLFSLGLACLTCSITMICFLYIFQSSRRNVLEVGLWSGAIITLLSLAAFAITAYSIDIKDYQFSDHTDYHLYYEHLFWAGGHLLQFTYITFLLIAWLYLASSCKLTLGYHAPIWIKRVFMLQILCLLHQHLFFIFQQDVTDYLHFFTQHMRYLGGVAPLIVTGIIAMLWTSQRHQCTLGYRNPCASSLILSVILFAFGGALGFLISGTNVTIPAHYHGSLASVTMAFMGLCIVLFPKFGFKPITGKIASIQPYIYATGHIVHITGLAIMGGYGALRKTAASSAHVDTIIGKSLFFLGGVMAMIGGLLFVIIAIRAIVTSDILSLFGGIFRKKNI